VIGKTSGVLTASINGEISPITIKGFFSVNPDGSVFEIEQQTGGPNARQISTTGFLSLSIPKRR
jgi:hypothetical protein